MNCDCVNRIKQNIKDKLYNNYVKLNIEFDGACFIYTENATIDSLSVPVTIKDASGKKLEKINFAIRYCPFCGKEIDK